MLDSIRLVDFKNHADTTVRLGRLTLLVGPNGAGKSGVLQGIQVASRLIREGRSKTLKYANDPTVVTRRGAPGFAIELHGHDSGREDSAPEGGDESEWTLDLSWHASGGPNWRFQGNTEEAPEPTTLNSDFPLARHHIKSARHALGEAAKLRFSASKLARPSYLAYSEARVDSEGNGLASTIAHLMTFERDRFEQLERDLISLVPSVKRIRVRRIEIADPTDRTEDDHEEVRTVLADELLLDMRSGDQLPRHAISEGTLILLGLLTVLTDPDCPSILLINDIDQSLHPAAQANLIRLLRRTLERHPELQIVATSHSPYLIDELSDDEVWVLALRDDGTAAAACLADHPDAERFRGVLRTGEFLSSVGEEWVVDRGAGDAAHPDR